MIVGIGYKSAYLQRNDIFWNKFVLTYKFEVKQGGGNCLYKAPTFSAGKKGMATIKKKPVQNKVEFTC